MRARKKKRKVDLASKLRTITVFSLPREPHRGFLRLGALTLQCALGRSGVTYLKREGDGATPAGRLRLISLVLRPDRGPRLRSLLPSRIMRQSDGWCEDKGSGLYNRPIRLPSPAAGHESMWRADALYDVVGVLDWNLSPRIRGRGSAIFLHLARPGYRPTAGCIALNRRDLGLLLAAAGCNPIFVVGGKPRKRLKR
jgi:L,D-peptidoglycan transpeptidase YkuD (ErfK/YbiS/YcfS/YnhG family)